jgi:CBS domain-containing protein
MCATVEGGRLTVQTSVILGAPDRQILALAREHAVDLIVMVTHGSSGAGRGWLGSVANDVVRRASVPVFLVSARSLVARIGRAYQVADVMTRDIVAVRVDGPLDVVGADGTLVGVITEHDLLRWQMETARPRTGQTTAEVIPGLLETVRASEVMSRLVVSVEESLPLTSAVPTLLEFPYRRLPVTRQGRTVGILSRADVLRALAEQDVAGIESTPIETTGGA